MRVSVKGEERALKRRKKEKEILYASKSDFVLLVINQFAPGIHHWFLIPFISQRTLWNTFSKQAMNNLGELVSPCQVEGFVVIKQAND